MGPGFKSPRLHCKPRLRLKQAGFFHGEYGTPQRAGREELRVCSSIGRQECLPHQRAVFSVGQTGMSAPLESGYFGGADRNVCPTRESSLVGGADIPVCPFWNRLSEDLAAGFAHFRFEKVSQLRGQAVRRQGRVAGAAEEQ